MTTNQTIDGVPRELLESAWEISVDTWSRAEELRALLDAKPETVAGHHPACRAVDDYKPGECSHDCKPANQPQPDPVLCRFYDVTDWTDLVRELVGHVAQLQDSAKRNVKPWEDTFPPTLLPAYVERVNAENAEVLSQPAYRLLDDGDVIKDGDETLNDDTATWGKVPMGVFIGMPYNRRVMLPVRRVKT